ncbi:MAG: non-canonical purine NTP pyrophosphatase [Phycisphaeraceae bacterium]
MSEPVCQLLIATGNPHKVDEIAAALGGHLEGIALRSLREVGVGIEEPVEDRGTFVGNAAVKAVGYAAATGMVCVADDSGLVVDELEGRPGVDSAFYAMDEVGPEAWAGMSRGERDLANNRKLLRELKGVPLVRRAARFVCTMVVAAPPTMKLANSLTSLEGVPGDLRGRCLAVVRGEVEGRILQPEEAADSGVGGEAFRGRGVNGFGYDPLFVLGEDGGHEGRTTAELPPEVKLQVSHRGRACMKLVVFGVLAGVVSVGG